MVYLLTSVTYYVRSDFISTELLLSETVTIESTLLNFRFLIWMKPKESSENCNCHFAGNIKYKDLYSSLPSADFSTSECLFLFQELEARKFAYLCTYLPSVQLFTGRQHQYDSLRKTWFHLYWIAPLRNSWPLFRLHSNEESEVWQCKFNYVLSLRWK